MNIKKALSVVLPLGLLVAWIITLENLPSTDIDGAGYYTFFLAVIGIAAILMYSIVIGTKWLTKKKPETNRKFVVSAVLGFVVATSLTFIYFVLVT